MIATAASRPETSNPTNTEEPDDDDGASTFVTPSCKRGEEKTFVSNSVCVCVCVCVCVLGVVNKKIEACVESPLSSSSLDCVVYSSPVSRGKLS